MKVSECMTKSPHVVAVDATIHDAAKMMSESGAGVLPVSERDQLVGMVTDRDIAVRAIAKAKGLDTKIRDVMTPDVKYCFEDEDLEHVAANMAEQQVRRLPVMNRDKRLVGILSLGDIAVGRESDLAATALEGIAQPAGRQKA